MSLLPSLTQMLKSQKNGQMKMMAIGSLLQFLTLNVKLLLVAVLMSLLRSQTQLTRANGEFLAV
jgi:hypothetical protein